VFYDKVDIVEFLQLEQLGRGELDVGCATARDHLHMPMG
jgi:hypothetical protein